MLAFEIETAHETAQLQQGKPILLPVRVNYTGPLPEPLSSILDPIQYFLWEGEHDNLGLITELKEALKHLPEGSLEQATAGFAREEEPLPLPRLNLSRLRAPPRSKRLAARFR